MTPRLRYKKTGNPLYERPPDLRVFIDDTEEARIYDEDNKNEEPTEEPTNESTNEGRYNSPEETYYNDDNAKSVYFTTQPKGWWSTQEIIRALSETKIRQTIENYRQAISLLENELISRRVSPSDNFRQYSRLAIQETRHYTRQNSKLSGTSRRHLLGILKKRSLSREQRQEILDSWLELIAEYKESL